MSGQVDRKGRQAERKRCGVPGVCVQAGAVEKRHLRCALAESQRAERAAVVECEHEALDRGDGYAQGLRLCVEEGELCQSGHVTIVLRERSAGETREQSAKAIAAIT